MSQHPTLKLKLSSQPPQQDPPPLAIPHSATSTGSQKIKLTFGSKPTPALSTSAPASSSKPGPKPTRKTKPTPKKRALEAVEESESDSEPRHTQSTASSKGPAVKRLKFNTSTPLIKLKGRPPPRPIGVGYDSAASDCEPDPVIDNDFILRMQPGEDCDYLRQAVAEQRFGPRSRGGADVHMLFLTKDGRRAVVTIKGKHYAASLVDLPCVIEAMKSWDKKGWLKSADVCQMLLVLGRINEEEEALTYPLPTAHGELEEKSWQYAHGITPPLRWVRKRRFRKRISVRAVEEDEEEVERLLQADEECEGVSSYRYIDPEALDREQSMRESIEAQQDQDAEGDIDDTSLYPSAAAAPAAGGEDFNDSDIDDGLEGALESAMALQATPDQTFTPITSTSAAPIASPVGITSAQTLSAIPSPAAAAASATEEESSDVDESDEEAPLDDDALEKQQEEQRQREEIADLEAAIRREEEKLGKTGNAILRQKLLRSIGSLRGDLDLKIGGMERGVRSVGGTSLGGIWWFEGLRGRW